MTTGERLRQPDVSSAPNPVTAAGMELGYLLDVAASPREVFSGLVRIGRVLTEDNDPTGHPFCVPLLGSGHVTISDSSPRNRPEQASMSGDNHQVATGVMANILTGAIAAQPYGSVHITLSNPMWSGEELSRLNIPGHDDRYRFALNDDLADIIRETAADLRLRRQHRELIFCGHETFRETLENGQTPLVPWRIVALMGRDNEPLDPQTQAELDEIAHDGAKYGVSLVCGGGLSLSKRPPNNVSRLKILQDKWLSHESIPDLYVYLDEPPTPESIKQAIAASKDRQIKPEESSRPCETYPHMVINGLHKIAQAREAMQTLAERSPKEFPYLDPAFLEQWVKLGAEKYSKVLKDLFRPDRDNTAVVAANALGMADNPNLIVPKMMAWAAYQIGLASRNPSNRQIPPRLGQQAQDMLAQYLPHLQNLAELILHPSSLPDVAKPYIAKQLPKEPPAWLFQLLADAAYPDETLLPGGRFMEPQLQIAPAVTSYLAQKFYPGELPPNKMPPIAHPLSMPSVRNALIELALMHLYDFNNVETSNELCDALVWRGAHRLAHVDPQNLPESARSAHAAANRYLSTMPGFKIVEMTRA